MFQKTPAVKNRVLSMFFLHIYQMEESNSAPGLASKFWTDVENDNTYLSDVRALKQDI